MARCIHAVGSALALCLLVTAAGLGGPAAAGADTSVQSISLWKQGAQPVAWSATPDLVYYNAIGPDGMFDGYSANPDGSDPTCLTCSQPAFAGAGAATQRGISDVSSDGRYMLLEVENPNHLGPAGQTISEPGKGAYDDVWLASSDGSQMWPLTNVTAPGSGLIGTMWARFSPSGNQIVFAEMYAPALADLGYWKLVVATIVWNDGVPSLADQSVIEPAPGLFMEPYGFTPDGSKVIFDTDFDQPSWMDSQIFEANTDGSDLTRLSPADAPDGVFTDYNEFAFFTPSGNSIIYGRTVDATPEGLEYWTMNPDGSGSRRLTYFDTPWSTESQSYAAVGSLAFNPDDPDQFLAAVQQSVDAQTKTALLVTLSDPSQARGLNAEFFSGANTFSGTPVTEVDNPSSGLLWSGAPAPGISATGYSVRWTGTIAPPQTGTYGLCLVADQTARLYVAGELLINSQEMLGQRSCATVSAVAGQPFPVEVDYSHGQPGNGYLQLSWIPPGAASGLSATAGSAPLNWAGNASAGEIIPSADMSPSVATVAAVGPATAPAVAPGAATAAGPEAVTAAGTSPSNPPAGKAAHPARKRARRKRAKRRRPRRKPAARANRRAVKQQSDERTRTARRP